MQQVRIVELGGLLAVVYVRPKELVHRCGVFSEALLVRARLRCELWASASTDIAVVTVQRGEWRALALARGRSGRRSGGSSTMRRRRVVLARRRRAVAKDLEKHLLADEAHHGWVVRWGLATRPPRAGSFARAPVAKCGPTLAAARPCICAGARVAEHRLSAAFAPSCATTTAARRGATNGAARASGAALGRLRRCCFEPPSGPLAQPGPRPYHSLDSGGHWSAPYSLAPRPCIKHGSLTHC
eukprot:scaffold1824_cov332-Prasinococcus_capsulatus_cf.AAC.11